MRELWELRCNATQRYFECVQRVIESPADWWLAQHARLQELNISEIMALLHPEVYVHRRCYRDQLTGGTCPIRGGRAFKSQNLPPKPYCDTQQLWIYKCTGAWRNASALGVDLDDDDASYVRQDHLFPYSFGGVTTLENQGVLCGLHNAIKAHDVHVWPWEKWDLHGTAPRWVFDALRRISPLIR